MLMLIFCVMRLLGSHVARHSKISGFNVIMPEPKGVHVRLTVVRIGWVATNADNN